MAGISPAYGLPLSLPCTMAIFSASVIRARTWFARVGGGAPEPTHGQSARGVVATAAVVAEVSAVRTRAAGRTAAMARTNRAGPRRGEGVRVTSEAPVVASA